MLISNSVIKYQTTKQWNSQSNQEAIHMVGSPWHHQRGIFLFVVFFSVQVSKCTGLTIKLVSGNSNWTHFTHVQPWNRPPFAAGAHSKLDHSFSLYFSDKSSFYKWLVSFVRRWICQLILQKCPERFGNGKWQWSLDIALLKHKFYL